MKKRVLPLVPLVPLIIVLALPALGPAALGSPASAVIALAKEAKKDAENCYKQALKQFKEGLKALRAEVKAGNVSPEAAIEQATALAAELSKHLDEHALFVLTEFLNKAEALLPGLDALPKGFLAGDCGAVDQVLAALDGKMAKVVKQAKMLLAAFGKDMVKANVEVKIDVRIQIFMTPPRKEVPDNPAPDPKPLKITSTSSAGDSSVQNDGALSLHGQAPALGNVTVTLRGPNGELITQMVPVNPDCTFSVGFPHAPGNGPGNLAEGNWQIEVSQGDQSVSKFHGV